MIPGIGNAGRLEYTFVRLSIKSLAVHASFKTTTGDLPIQTVIIGPYLLPHSSNLYHGLTLGNCKTFPRIGIENGPGGIFFRNRSIHAKSTNRKMTGTSDHAM